MGEDALECDLSPSAILSCRAWCATPRSTPILAPAAAQPESVHRLLLLPHFYLAGPDRRGTRTTKDAVKVDPALRCDPLLCQGIGVKGCCFVECMAWVLYCGLVRSSHHHRRHSMYPILDAVFSECRPNSATRVLTSSALYHAIKRQLSPTVFASASSRNLAFFVALTLGHGGRLDVRSTWSGSRSDRQPICSNNTDS